jgi:peptidoglycan-N-acetylglucosamine deacetylase
VQFVQTTVKFHTSNLELARSRSNHWLPNRARTNPADPRCEQAAVDPFVLDRLCSPPVSILIGDIDRMDDLLRTLQPVSPLVERRTVFRYPFLDEGATLEKRNAVRRHLFEKGYKIAQVTIDYNDWAWNDAYTRCVMNHDHESIAWLKANIMQEAGRSLESSHALAKLLFGRDIAHILLIHVGAFDALMLDPILTNFRARGVNFVTLDEALTDPVYQIDPKYVFEGGRGFLEQIVEARHADTGGVLREPLYSVPRLGQVCKQS